MNDDNFIIEQFTWSFSRLNSMQQCPRAWEKTYILMEDRDSSAYAECGSLCHENLQAYFEGKRSEFELAPYFQEHYQEYVTSPYPANLGDTCYDKCLDYFNNFSFPIEKYEVLGVEKEVRFKLGGKYDFVGYIDVLLRERDTGKIILMDHKSSDLKILKNGNVSKSDQEHWMAFKRQQLLYSYAVLQEYGRVDILRWNLFKKQQFIEIEWTKEQMDEAIQWALDTIHRIENTNEYPANPQYFFCVNLCDHRNDNCPYKRLGMIYDGIFSKCYKEKCKDYMYYGGAGITMCDAWKEDKQEFFKWALDNGYQDDLVLKRYDEDGGYDEFNCYWTWRDKYAYE